MIFHLNRLRPLNGNKIMNKKHILWVLLGLFFAAPVMLRAQVVVEKSTEIVTISSKQYYMHHVKSGETLYSIAKVYEVSQEEILRLNPEINDLGLQADMVIGIPVVVQQQESVLPSDIELDEDDEIGDGYIIHTVKESEKTKKLLRRYDADREEFRRLNPSVGSRVFVGQKVLIPCEGAKAPKKHEPDTLVIQQELVTDTIVEVVEEETLKGPYVLPKERPAGCYASAENKNRQYRVALMVPLYLDDINKLDASKAKADKTKNTRSMKFLQFYEGFMMAVDSLTEYHGLNLDLTVIDVHEDTITALAAVRQLRDHQPDLIVGPFFSKSFAVVQRYASSNGIMIVNPMSERESIILDAPNVVKLKPSNKAMVEELSDLISRRYPKAKVTLVTDDGLGLADTAMINDLERTLDTTVKKDIFLSNSEMLDLIARESQRRKMGKRVLSTLEVEGQIFSTKALGEYPDGEVYFENHFEHLSIAESNAFKNGLSTARENVLVAYGKDVVFSTKILNNTIKLAQKNPITLIGLPQWTEFENLLVPSLLSLNAIYFDDHFVDYNDSLTLNFVGAFRQRYESEPIDFAFEGFDVGWYFLNALMEFGPQPMECLPYYHIPLLHTRYYFNKRRYEDGLENRYWNVFQYDSQSVQLKPIWVYQEEGNE